MYYETATNGHGLPHDPLKALVAPRPIGWISSLDTDGTLNLAPYSFFNLLATNPAIVGFSSASKKDSQSNIEATGEFVCNFASVDLIDKLNATAKHVPAHVNEFELAGLTQIESRLIKAPVLLRHARIWNVAISRRWSFLRKKTAQWYGVSCSDRLLLCISTMHI